jgi:hypothetical protein
MIVCLKLAKLTSYRGIIPLLKAVTLFYYLYLILAEKAKPATLSVALLLLILLSVPETDFPTC